MHKRGKHKKVGAMLLITVLAMTTLTVSADKTTSGDTSNTTIPNNSRTTATEVELPVTLVLDGMILPELADSFNFDTDYIFTVGDIEDLNAYPIAVDKTELIAVSWDLDGNDIAVAGDMVTEDATLYIIFKTIETTLAPQDPTQGDNTPTPPPQDGDTPTTPLPDNDEPVTPPANDVPVTPPQEDVPQAPVVESPETGDIDFEEF